MKKIFILTFLVTVLMMFGVIANAQNPNNSNYPNDPNNPNYQDFRGYLGVLVSPDDQGGMAIEGFIKNTPASKLNRSGSIRRGDAIIKLAGRDVHSVRSLTRARDRIPFGKEGKMVLRDRNNQYYFVWIGRKDPAIARAAVAEGATEEQVKAQSSDEFSFGGKGMGEDQADIRDSKSKGSNEEVSAPIDDNTESVVPIDESPIDDINDDPDIR